MLVRGAHEISVSAPSRSRFCYNSETGRAASREGGRSETCPTEERNMRRGSLFAPLLLIGLGLLFLARNLYPDLRLMDYLAKFWPLLLVLWGVLRIAEVLFWASTRQALPTSGVTPGEWLFVILLCCFGATLHAVRGFSGWFPGTIELGG